MKKPIKILKPCPVNDQELPKVSADQKYCSSCNKNIYDFTSKTEQEVTHILQTKKNVCGEFNFAQPLNYKETLYHRKLAKFALTLLLVFGTGLYSYSHDTELAISSIKAELISSQPINLTTVVGQVLKTHGYETIKVFYNDSLLQVVPLDSVGNFSFEVPEEYQNETLRFELNEYDFNPVSKKIVKGVKLRLKFSKKRYIHKTRGVPAYHD
jgi:hypothetical protein